MFLPLIKGVILSEAKDPGTVHPFTTDQSHQPPNEVWGADRLIPARWYCGQTGASADFVKQQADIVRIVGQSVKLRKSDAQNYSTRTFSPRITDAYLIDTSRHP